MKQQSKPFVYLIVASLLATAGMLFYFGLNDIRELRELQDNGIVTIATVAEQFTEQRKSGNSSYNSHCLRLTFKTSNNDTVNEAICQNSSDIWREHAVNKQIDILYSPNDPSNLVIGRIAPQEDVGSYTFFFGAALELTIALYFLLRGFKATREQKERATSP